jgi:hypothetical protein
MRIGCVAEIRYIGVTIISAGADRMVSNYLGTPVHADRTFREYEGPIDTILVAGCMGPRELHF